MRKKVRFVICFAHAHGQALSKSKILERQMRQIHRKKIERDAYVVFFWIEIPEGSAFVAGRPSTQSTVLISVPDDISQPTREELMSSICELWMRETTCSMEEIVVTACGATLFKEYLVASRQRIAPAAFWPLAAHIALDAAWRRFTHGHFSTSLDMPRARWTGSLSANVESVSRKYT